MLAKTISKRLRWGKSLLQQTYDRSAILTVASRASDWKTAWGGRPPGTQRTDIFIGEADMVDREHGSAFIRAFVERLPSTGAPRVLVDRDPTNVRAVRACAKVTSRPHPLVDTPNGPVLLMVCTS